MLEQVQEIDILHQDISKCEKCNLCSHKKGYRNTVRRGIDSADILLVGEAPGQNEEESGIPFVGEAGVMLEEILKCVGLENRVYLTNLVKCRPLNNKKPEKQEIESCLPWLVDQIAILQPKILVLAGMTAYTGFVGNKWVDGSKFGITKHRGIWFEYSGIPSISVFHPSYLLRNPKLDQGTPKYMALKDFISIKEKLECLYQEQM